jgi:ferrous iron transport protein B
VTDLTFFHQLLVENGWTTLTAVNMLLFTLMHWPCATTLLSIGKESKSLKWAVIAVIAPLTLGLIFCSVTTAFSCIIG